MQTMWFKLLVTVCVLVESVLSRDSPVVDSPSGKYRGHTLKARDGRDILSFQGIPYAEPPIGHLRFKEPVKKPRLEDEYEAVDDSRECYQPVFDFTRLNNLTIFKGTEDCLYLNVYTPSMEKNTLKLPVFVWIHGGGYFLASGSTFYNGPEYLLDRDIILVTINYRLGPLGFMSTEDRVIPGNLGMKDQVMALRWVQENIAAFGGDPNQVTIGGESAGATSVVQHLYSQLSKGLFQRSIAQSGSIDCIWSTKTGKEARQVTEKVAAQVECSLDDKDFLTCLQSKSLDQLFMAAHAIKDPMGVLEMIFVPIIEEESPEAFLTQTSVQMDSNIPLIIGVTSLESLGMPAFMTALNTKYSKMSGIREDHERLFPVVAYYFNHPEASTITKQLVKFYFGQQGITDDSHLQFINMVGDLMFNHGVHVRAKNHKGKVFLYKFSYKGAITATPLVPKGLEGEVGHSEDLLYFFHFNFIAHGPLNKQDRAMSEKVIDAWYNFIKTGDPTPDSKQWRESEKGINYLDITNEGFTMKTNMFQDRMEFLDKLNIGTRQTFGHDEL